MHFLSEDLENYANTHIKKSLRSLRALNREPTLGYYSLACLVDTYKVGF